MVSKISKLAVASCLISLSAGALAVAPDFMDKLAADSRPMEDKARDGARRPYQVMHLLGVEEGMTVLDVGSGGGWYTRVLSAAVGPSGHVVAQFGPRAMQQNNGMAQKDLAKSLGNTEAFFGNLDDLDANTFDVAVTALNLHHADEQRGVAQLTGIRNALKPGGVAAVIDHIGLPNIDNSRLHRIPTDEVRQWIRSAGLEIVQESDILHTMADDHTMSARDPRLGRNVDRFLFVVRKPR